MKNAAVWKGKAVRRRKTARKESDLAPKAVPGGCQYTQLKAQGELCIIAVFVFI